MKTYYKPDRDIKPPRNSHSVRCAKCKIYITRDDITYWWIQIGNNIYCEKHYKLDKQQLKVVK